MLLLKTKTVQIFIFSLCLLLLTQCFADELLVEPEMGRGPILSSINNSHHIQLVMYGLTDKTLIQALADSAMQKKEITILLEPHPYKSNKENQYAINKLKLSNIKILAPNSLFHLTHQKTFIFDNKNALIMTFNLTYSAFKTQRNFGIYIDDPLMIQEINQVLANDAKQKKTVMNNPRLMWCPENCRERLLNFIENAHHSIKIYTQELADYQTIGELAKKAREGVSVQIIMPPYQSSKKFTFLHNAGVKIYFNHEYYIHAKIIIIDDKKALLGSINLTKASLNDNRELSIIETDPKIIHQLVSTFMEDLKES